MEWHKRMYKNDSGNIRRKKQHSRRDNLHFGKWNMSSIIRETDNQTTISVYNTNGQLLKSTRLNSITIGQEEILNLSGFVPGIYIIHIKGNNIQKKPKDNPIILEPVKR